MVVLGSPALKNMNFTIDFDENLIGLSGGQDLTTLYTDYTGRVAILVTIFAMIALAGFSINIMIDKARSAIKEQ